MGPTDCTDSPTFRVLRSEDTTGWVSSAAGTERGCTAASTREQKLRSKVKAPAGSGFLGAGFLAGRCPLITMPLPAERARGEIPSCPVRVGPPPAALLTLSLQTRSHEGFDINTGTSGGHDASAEVTLLGRSAFVRVMS